MRPGTPSSSSELPRRERAWSCATLSKLLRSVLCAVRAWMRAVGDVASFILSLCKRDLSTKNSARVDTTVLGLQRP